MMSNVFVFFINGPTIHQAL